MEKVGGKVHSEEMVEKGRAERNAKGFEQEAERDLR
jgi:hypothetical protein